MNRKLTSLIEAKNFNEVLTFQRQLNKLLVVTRGEKGSVAILGDEIIEVGIQKNLKILDLNWCW